MALRLTLKPHERVILGGAVLRNGGSRVDLLIENRVPVLRGADIMSPSAVRTPCERVYLALQLMYVDPDQAEGHRESYRSLVAEVLEAAPSCRRPIERIEASVAAGQLYQALKAARALIEHEQELMSHVQ
jgi:flagellar biosynthesis repressor protein FlbT